MGADSKIEWTDHTFNPWIGCTKVSPGCDHCYAETQDSRFGHSAWGPHAERRMTKPAYWGQPRLWNERAKAAGKPAFVFCASMADVFDNQVEDSWRTQLFTIIALTPHLRWLLLTKRPQNIEKMLHVQHNGEPWPNVWLGVSVENQEEAERRVPLLLKAPAAKRFLSCEPLLGPLRLDGWLRTKPKDPVVNWVICGGESGREARPMHPDWARRLRDQCANAGVPFLFKQWGEWGPCELHPVGTALLQVIGHDGQLLDDPLDRPDDAHAEIICRFGKRRAGRLLDGVEHNGRPSP